METFVERMPTEQLKVFISSAQSQEGAFIWKDVRRRIKDRLSLCPCLAPYIIEDVASPIPSTQLFLMQVEKCDLYVLLLKGEGRKGTLSEFACAYNINKPMLVYFLKDDTPDTNVIAIKQKLIKNDRCTFRELSDFSNIESSIWKDIMENLVLFFRLKKSFFESDEKAVDISIDEKQDHIRPGIPSKTEIKRFSSCYNYLLTKIGLDYLISNNKVEEAKWHSFGCSLIDWLVSGRWEVKKSDIIEFIAIVADVFKKPDWMDNRWNAIRAYIAGDTTKALLEEEIALQYAKEADESSWIINNILIDCRNFEHELHIQTRKIGNEGKHQEELNSQKEMVSFPVLDRYLTNIYGYIEKDEFRIKTASPHTQLLGSSLPYALQDLANYIFTAAIYGSDTHLYRAREIFAFIMDRYSIIGNNAELAFVAFRQYILLGICKDLASYIRGAWDRIYSFVTTHADEMWELTDLVPFINRDSMKISVFNKLGQYFTDPVFEEAEKYILAFSKEVNSNNSDLYFDAIYQNLYRMNSCGVVQVIVPIIAERRFWQGYKITSIIKNIKLDQVNESILQTLAETLQIQLPYIIENNGDPQMIAALVEQNRKVFGHLEEIDGNGLKGLQKAIYNINLGLDKWDNLLKEEIQIARSQFEKNSKKGVFHGFAHDPYGVIRSVMRNGAGDEEIDRIIIQELIPLFIDVLNSEAAVQTKEPCASCLCEVLSYYKKKGMKLPKELTETIEAIDIQKGTDFQFSSGRKALEIRIIMAKVLAGITNINSLLVWCVDFGTLEARDKMVVIDCLEKYLYHQKEYEKENDLLILSIVLQCSADQNFEVRQIAVKCLAYILRNNPHEAEAVIALNKTVYDPSENVRNTALYLCKSGTIPSDISATMIEQFLNDACYTIRERAKQK